MTKEKTIIEWGYDLASLLRILSLAVEGEQIASMSFADSGGGTVLDRAADMAFDIAERSERSEKPPRQRAG